jgi:hypothetical protein
VSDGQAFQRYWVSWDRFLPRPDKFYREEIDPYHRKPHCEPHPRCAMRLPRRIHRSSVPIDTLAQQDCFGLKSHRMYTLNDWEGQENSFWQLQLRRSAHEFEIIWSKEIS